MKSIFILDDDHDLCELMLMCFASLESPLYSSFHSLKQLKESGDLSKYQIAMLDVNLGLGEPDGVEAYKYLTQIDYRGEIYFFTGHGSFDNRIKEVAKKNNIRILDKPLRIEELAKILRKVE